MSAVRHDAERTAGFALLKQRLDLPACAAALVLVLGCVAWVFPRTAAAVGGWVLPALCVAAFALTFVLVAGWPWLRGFVAALVVTVLIGGRAALTTGTGIAHLTGAALGLLAMLWLGHVITTPQRLRWTAVVYLAGGLVVLVLGLTGSYFPELAPIMSRLTAGLPDLRLGLAGIGPYGYVNPNALAASALLIAPFAFAVVILKTRERSELLGVLPLGLLVLMAGLFVLVVTRSRSAWFAIWLTIAVVVLRGLRSPGWRIATIAVLIIPPLAVVALIPFVTQEQFLLKAGGLWSTVNVRVDVMTAAFEHFKTSPWLGIGLNNFRNVYQNPRPGDIAHAHNMFLQTALDIGVFGLAAYCCVLGFLLKRADDVARGEATLSRGVAVGAALSLLSVTAFGLGDAVPLGTKIGLLQWLLAGAILGAWRVQADLPRVDRQ